MTNHDEVRETHYHYFKSRKLVQIGSLFICYNKKTAEHQIIIDNQEMPEGFRVESTYPRYKNE